MWLAWLLTLPPRPSFWIVVLSGIPLLVLGSWLLHQHLDVGPWRTFARATADYHLLAAVLLVAFGVQFEDAHGVTTDGVIYFTQLRSVIFDRDLDVAAEFASLGQPPRPYHVVPIGPTVVWLPLYAIVALIDAAGRAIGWWSGPAEPIARGLTLPYVRAALVSSFAIGAIGLAAVHRLLRAEFGARVAIVTTLLLLGATPLVWYMVYEPSMTHAASFGFVALFVVAAVRWTTIAISPRQALRLGVLLGLAFISRPQEGLFALLPATLLVTADAPWRARRQAVMRTAIYAFIGMVPFFVLQTIHSSILVSREQFALVGSAGYLHLWSSRWDDVLWSSWHGFLSWTPIVYVALIGVIAYARRSWRWTIATVLIVFLMAWVNGATADWNAGWSFGGRRFTSCLVLLAPGLALVIHTMLRQPMAAIAVLAFVAVVWNQLLIAQYTSGMLPAGEPFRFAQLVRGQAVVLTRPPYFYPFAFPANALFAWRHGLPIDSYDLLAPEGIPRAIDIPFHERAARFFVDGWGTRAGDDWGPLYWINEPRAVMLVPFDPSGRALITMELRARTRLVDPPVSASLTIAINDQRVATLAPAASAPASASVEIDARVFRRGFNQVAFSKDASAPPVGIYRLSLK